MWQDCGQVGVQVCPLIQNDRWPLSLLPGDSGLAGMTGRASCTSGRQGDRPDPAPRSCDWDEVSARNVSWNYLFTRDGFLRCDAFVMRALHLSIGGRQTISRQEKTKSERRTVEQRSQVGIWDTAGILYLAKKPEVYNRSHFERPLLCQKWNKKRKRGSLNTVSGMFSFLHICYFIVFPSVQMMWQLNKFIPALP